MFIKLENGTYVNLGHISEIREPQPNHSSSSIMSWGSRSHDVRNGELFSEVILMNSRQYIKANDYKNIINIIEGN